MRHPAFECILSYVLLLLFASVFYGIGHFLLRSFGYREAGFYRSFFDKSLAGLTAVVLVFSIAITSFVTVQLGYLLVLFFLIYEFKRDRQQRSGNVSPKEYHSLKSFIPLLLLSLFIYGWFAFFTIKPGSEWGYFMPHIDKGYYATVSSMLLETGHENRVGVNAYYNNLTANEPYHYFDVWLNALVSFVTGTPPVLVMSLICLPLCGLLAVAGLLSVFERFGKVKPLYIVLAVLLLFVRGLYLVRVDPQIKWAQNFSETLLEFKSEKLGVIYVFAIFSFRLLLEGRLLPTLASFLLFPLLAIGSFPGVAGGLFLFLLLARIGKMISSLEMLRHLLYLMLLSSFIFLFYKITGDPGSNPYLKNGMLTYTDMKGFSFQSIKVTCIELFVRVMHYPWHTLLIHLPYLIFALIVMRGNKQLRGAFLLVSCIYFVSLVTFGFFYKLLDGPQFYTNNLPLLNVFLAMGMIVFLSSDVLARHVKNMFAGIVICLLLVQAYFSVMAYRDSRVFTELYSDGYLSAVNKMHKGLDKKERVAILYNQNQVPDLYNSDKSGANVLYLSFMPNFLPAVDLNVFEIDQWAPDKEIAAIQKRFVQNAPFHRFVLEQVSRATFKGLSESRLDFMKAHNIRFLVVSPGITPDHNITALVKKQLRDPLSGELFLLLNPIP